MASLGTAYLDVQPDLSSLNKQMGAFFAGSKWSSISKKAAVGLGAITVAGAAAGKALYDVGEAFDDASDRIRVGTGKTGKELGKLEKDFKSVIRDVPTDFKTASTAIADLNTRLGITGKPLRQLTKQFTELSRITETDVESNVQSVTRAFGDWEVKTKRQSRQLDFFFKAAQASGAEVSDLASQVVQFGAPLRQVGFSLDEATAMFAQFEKAGVNTQTMMPGLKFALKSFLAEDIDPQKGLARTFEGIEKGTIDATEAFEIFGQRATPDMIEAIQQGRFDLDKFTESIAENDETVRKAGRETMDFSEHWLRFKNNVLLGLEPVATRVFDAVGDAMKDVTKIIADPKLTSAEKFEQLRDLAVDALSDLVSKAGEIAPKVVGALGKGIGKAWTEMNPLGKLFTTAALIRVIGGRGALLGVGASLGRFLGIGIASGAGSALAGGTAGGVAAGTAGAGFLGGIKKFIKRAPLIAGGVYAGEQVISGVQHAVEEGSDDAFAALTAHADTDFFEGLKGKFEGLQLIGPADDSFKDSAKAAERVLDTLEDIRTTGRTLSLPAMEELKTDLAQVEGLSVDARRQVDALLAPSELVEKVDRAGDRIRESYKGAFNLRDIKQQHLSDLRTIASNFGKGTKEAELLSGRTNQALAKHVSEMVNSGQISTDKGKRWLREFGMSAEDLIPPVHKMSQKAMMLFKGVGDETKRTFVKTDQGFQKFKGDAKDAFLSASKNAKKHSGDMKDSVLGNVGSMVGGVGAGIGDFKDNLNSALKAMNAKQVTFSIQKADALGAWRNKQRGGHINVGKPSGDSVPAMLEKDEYVLNSKLTKKIGVDKLDALNFGAVPRFGFQAGGAVGGLQAGIARLAKFASERFGLTVSSGLRSGAPGASWHNTGEAVDLVPPSMKATQGIFAAFRNQLEELFYDPWGGYDSGQRIGAIGGHLDHIHAAILGGGGGGPAMVKRLKKLILQGPDGPLKSMGQGALDKAHSAANRFLMKQTPSHGNLGAAAGALSDAEFLALARRAIAITSASKAFGRFDPSEFSPEGLRVLSMAESSLIPSSINNWDINAKAGNPSGGLMHLTRSNMKAYAEPGLGSNMFNPLASIAASINYQIARYGGQVTHSPYQWGGLVGLQKGGDGKHAKKQTRMLTNARQTLRRLLGRIAKTDERIDIAQRLASLESSPAGSDLSTAEKAKQIRLHENLLGRLTKARQIARMGIRLSGRMGKGATAFRDPLIELEGLTGKSGRIFDTKLALDELKSTHTGLLPASMSISQFQEFMDSIAYGVWKRAPIMHQGGTVPGPVGSPQPTILQGGEHVSPIGGQHITVVVKDGAVDPNKIDVLVDGRLAEHDRRDYHDYRVR